MRDVRWRFVGTTLFAAFWAAGAGHAQTPATLRSRDGMVVSGSALASQVGADVLAAGGNAVDAAVATAFALSVVEPTMSGLGGRTQMLIRTPAGDYFGIDGTTEVPASYPVGAMPADDDASGWGTVAIPGTVAALAAALEAHGTWPLARVMEPAIALADGFTLPGPEAERIADASSALRQSEGTRTTFLHADGSPYAGGEGFAQPALAAVLRAIAREGPSAFYTGDIARRMADDVTANGGWLRYEDLASYRAEPAVIPRGSYRGTDIVGTYLPASGATTIETLHILENFDLSGIVGTPEWAALVAQALVLAFEDRAEAMEDPAVGARELTSKARAKRLSERVRAPAGVGEETFESANTTHLSVVDGHGGVVALTQSVGPLMGAKVATPGLGFVYAATMGYLGDLKPGDRPMSSQSPLILERDGEPVLVLGGAGARRILSAIVAVLSRILDAHTPLADAMAAPRLHPTSGRVDVEVRPGAAWSEADIADLRALGFEVRPRDEPTYFARINAIGREDGFWVGVSDPRWTGRAAAPRVPGVGGRRGDPGSEEESR